MNAVVAIVGRPNVGKSTLFNRLVKERKAIVSPIPGVTRDRIYAEVVWQEKRFFLIDTGGFEPLSRERLVSQIREQTQLAIEEADVIVHLFDAKEGLVPVDLDVHRHLRRANKPILSVVNKIDHRKYADSLSDFYELGVERLIPVSAEHGLGVEELMEEILKAIPEEGEKDAQTEREVYRVAVVGRPNVGKSSLTNRVLGYQRVVVDPVPGTTRDAVDTPFSFNGKPYVIIDTAGLRRKSRITGKLEVYSILRSLKAIDRSHLIILLIDGTEGLTSQDSKVASYAEERGKACILAANKWDLVMESQERATRERTLEKIRIRLKHLSYVPLLPLSAKTGLGIKELLKHMEKVSGEHNRHVSTPQINRLLQEASEHHTPPLYRNRRVKILYASQIQVRPPTFALVTNYPLGVPPSYERFLINQIRERFGFEGTPIKILFRPRSKKTLQKDSAIH